MGIYSWFRQICTLLNEWSRWIDGCENWRMYVQKGNWPYRNRSKIRNLKYSKGTGLIIYQQLQRAAYMNARIMTHTSNI